MGKLLEKAKSQTLRSGNVKEAFRNENGAIDLASIMVGIIVIGLIGGVIAATVFAVIPWSQDNAAKHQLESIHTAQNAYHGLSSDPARTLSTGALRNSFADSALLSTENLLTTGDSYCTIPLSDGKDYIGFVESASGKVFAATNTNKSAEVAETDLPCVDGEFSEDELADTFPLPEAGSGSETTPPPAPTYTQLRFYNFENTNEVSQFSRSQIYDTLSATSSYSYKISGNNSLLNTTSTQKGSVWFAFWNTNYEVGETYRITFKTKIIRSGVTQSVRATYGWGATEFKSNTVKGDPTKDVVETVTLDFVPTKASDQVTIWGDALDSTQRPYLVVDDFKLERVD